MPLVTLLIQKDFETRDQVDDEIAMLSSDGWSVDIEDEGDFAEDEEE